MDKLEGVPIVNKTDLINYLLNTEKEAWIKEDWDMLFEELEKILFYNKYA